MADKNSGWACTHSAEIVAEDDVGVVIRVICYWQNNHWTYNMNYVSAWVYCAGQEVCVKSSGSINTTGNNTAAYEMGRYDFYLSKSYAWQNVSCSAKITSTSSYASGTKSSSASTVGFGAKTSYTISYNGNGGTNVPGSHTKWYNETAYLSSTIPTRDGHDFVNWNIYAIGNGPSYNPGQAYTDNSGLNLYAIWRAHTYEIKYNANGGENAPVTGTKTFGQDFTLSSKTPSRTNYNFLGWSTTPTGSVEYTSSQIYTKNEPVTLYAVWELAYVKPRLNNFTVTRCTADGTEEETGTYIRVTFDWATDYDVTAVHIDWNTDPYWANYENVAVTASGREDHVDTIVGNGEISTETSYYFRAFVSDQYDYTHSQTLAVGTIKYPIDIKDGGTGVAIGKVAEDDSFDVGMYSKFRQNVEMFGEVTKEGGYYQAFRGYSPNANESITHGYYHVNPDTVNIPEGTKYGMIETVESRGKTWDHADGASWVWQFFRNSTGVEYLRTGANEETMTPWRRDYKGTTIFENVTGETGTVMLDEDAGNFRWLEIHFYDYDNNYGRAIAFSGAPSGLTSFFYLGHLSTSYIKGNFVIPNGKTMSRVVGWEVAVTASGTTLGTTTVDTTYTLFRIIRVIGYK